MNDLAYYVLLVVAIGIGWYLGRRAARPRTASKELPSQYYRGLNYLLDGRPDGAIDAFIGALEVNSETLETHLALGNLLRRKGEVDRAIRVHQNLLARPSLPRAQVHQAHLELARDYISAGLLDRAERLLQDLVKESPQQRSASQHHLMEIFQSQRDWQQAIEVANALLPKKSLLGGGSAITATGHTGQPVTQALAHYYCELALERIELGNLSAARDALQQALSHDKACVRASIILGDVELRAGNYKLAIKALRKVRLQDADMVPESIALLRECYQQLGDQKSLRSYLQECLDTNPSAPLAVAVAEDLRAAKGEEEAEQFLAEQLAARPSLRGLAHLIDLQLDTVEGGAQDNLTLLQRLVERLVEERPAYRCGHCGFAGRQLHWHCPGCKHWGSMKSIRGTRAE